MQADKTLKLFVGVLVISLIAQGITWLQLRRLQNEVSQMFTCRLRCRSTSGTCFSRRSPTYEDAVRFMEEQNRWIMEQEWQLDGCGEEVPVTFTWVFRELPPVDNVAVEVRPSRPMDWQLVPAQPSGRLAYRSELLLDGRVEWECRVVAEGPGGVRATEPQVVDAFNQLRRQELILYQGDAVTVVDRTCLICAAEPGPGSE